MPVEAPEVSGNRPVVVVVGSVNPDLVPGGSGETESLLPAVALAVLGAALRDRDLARA